MMDIQNLSALKSFILCLMLREVDFGTLFRGGSESALFAIKIQENHSIFNNHLRIEWIRSTCKAENLLCINGFT